MQSLLAFVVADSSIMIVTKRDALRNPRPVRSLLCIEPIHVERVTNRSTYESDQKTAEATKLATLQAATDTQQETISQLGAHPTGGTSLAAGVSSANDAKIRTANATYQTTALSAEATKQVTITNSRAKNLQNNGDTGPA
jgi:hypothetical protein